jgi:hypothetical protein
LKCHSVRGYNCIYLTNIYYIENLPEFIDIYDSIIAWTIRGDEEIRQKFWAIDVGRKSNYSRLLDVQEETEGQAEPTEFEHEFEIEEDDQCTYLCTPPSLDISEFIK